MTDLGSISRQDFLRGLVLGAMSAALPASALAEGQSAQANTITLDDLRGFAKVAGLQFTDAELQQVLRDISGDRRGYADLRKLTTANDLVPMSVYRVPGWDALGPMKVDLRTAPVSVERPPRDEDLAFMTVAELGALLRARQTSSTELTRIYLERLKTYGSKLLCVVALTEEIAMRQAARADREMALGRFRGPLHGIPYGLKDLFSVKGYPTQWGTAAYKGQKLDVDCAVFERLSAAGAVCVAKLSLGALAMNDNWFAGRTKNPWKPEEGSSGSSAGSASAMAAGLVAFAIGTETSGSIVSPSLRCRVAGLRPTFGSVSRYGAMTLSWSMDKVGPICRTAEDAALVLAALLGKDSRDRGSIDRPFVYRTPSDLGGVKVGLYGTPNPEVVNLLLSLGAETGEFKIPKAIPGLGAIISVEAAAMFDEITVDGRLNLVTENEWPQIFRAARFVPAVEYVQAERARTLLVEAYLEAFEPFDLVVGNGSAGPMIYTTNLVGLPQIHVPFRPMPGNTYESFSLFAKPFEEAKLVGAAHLVQQRMAFHRLRPSLAAL